ncbi:hypothetical protein N7494_008400 [Penicillium frequentans]|uniref:Uncharacterized protein n=1 Tax=Penicillium frequentans TaxID=3151616 RepID=A0AAD6CUC0_9EURO|nr:hypothetical protein N7494_008400 [Penicillium glabrum]
MVPITFRLMSTDSSTHNCLLTTTILAPGLYRLRVANDSDLVARHVHGHPFAVVHTRLRVLLLDQDPAFLILLFFRAILSELSFSNKTTSRRRTLGQPRAQDPPRLAGEHEPREQVQIRDLQQALDRHNDSPYLQFSESKEGGQRALLKSEYGPGHECVDHE